MNTAVDDFTLAPMMPPTVGAAPELARLGDAIAELSAHLDAATARLLDLLREFDARGGWGNGSGFRSCAHWLMWRVGLNPGAARERVRVARALGTLPRLAEALARGELSYSKVRALTRVATAETEERLLRVGRAGTAEHVERVVRGRLEPETGAVLMKALTAARESLYPTGHARNGSAETRSAVIHPQTGMLVGEDIPTWGQQQADALALLAETALHHGSDPGTPGERYQVVVHVDAPVRAESDASAAPNAPGQSLVRDGAHVSAETSQRLACDATRVVMRHDADGQVTEVGARTRTIPPALRRALQHRDRGCRFPGCGLPFGQGHHIRHWAHGGPTTLSNLALLCRRHHRALHEEGYQVERLSDGELQFRRPDGQLFPDVPPPTPVPADSAERLRAQNEAKGLHIHSRTAIPEWYGERLDVGWAIDVLHPLAASNS